MGQYGAVFGMAYVKERAGSKWLTIRYRDLDTGIWKDETTGFLKGDPEGKRKAVKEALRRSALEKKVSPQRVGDFATWVTEYMASHYTNPNTLRRYTYAWENLQEWLLLNKIRHPRQFRYEHIQQYMAWKKSKDKPGKDGHNTARLEIFFLGFLMNEAIVREYAETNPVFLKEIKRHHQKAKEELTADNIRAARLAFQSKPSKWMSIVFEIMLNIGCRFSESRFPKSSVDFEEPSILMVDAKRDPNDKKKLFSVPITKPFAAYLKSLDWTDGYCVPLLDRSMNENFNSVLRKVCGTTSHSCRVSFITRCHRDGLSEIETMGLVNHSDRLVHKIYSRLNVKDSARALSRVKPPPPPLP